MASWVALFRGINIGGTSTLRMKDLAAQMQALGLDEIKTYIQSGNVVFQSPSRAGNALADRIAESVARHQGFRPQVLVLSAKKYRAAVASNPFPEAAADPKTLHLFFLASRPRSPDLTWLEETRRPAERFHLAADVLYLHTPDGFARSKLAAGVERHLGVPATARNWRTVGKILELLA